MGTVRRFSRCGKSQLDVWLRSEGSAFSTRRGLAFVLGRARRPHGTSRPAAWRLAGDVSRSYRRPGERRAPAAPRRRRNTGSSSHDAPDSFALTRAAGSRGSLRAPGMTIAEWWRVKAPLHRRRRPSRKVRRRSESSAEVGVVGSEIFFAVSEKSECEECGWAVSRLSSKTQFRTVPALMRAANPSARKARFAARPQRTASRTWPRRTAADTRAAATRWIVRMSGGAFSGRGSWTMPDSLTRPCVKDGRRGRMTEVSRDIAACARNARHRPHAPPRRFPCPHSSP